MNMLKIKEYDKVRDHCRETFEDKYVKDKRI